jgi:hypothetical protein
MLGAHTSTRSQIFGRKEGERVDLPPLQVRRPRVSESGLGPVRPLPDVVQMEEVPHGASPEADAIVVEREVLGHSERIRIGEEHAVVQGNGIARRQVTSGRRK